MRPLRFRIALFLGALCAILPVWGQQPAPEARILQYPSATQPLEVEISLGIPAGVHVYRSQKQFFRISETQSRNLGPMQITHSTPTTIADALTEEPFDTVEVFKQGDWVRMSRQATGRDGDPWAFEGAIRYQACTDEICFPPKTFAFSFSGTIGKAPDGHGGALSANAASESEPAPALQHWSQAVGQFSVVDSASGYMNADTFVKFLDRAEGEGAGSPSLLERLEGVGLWVAILLILVGGLALNLTPCVLPMIPVNLAIIGAGAVSGSRRKGFFLGLAYGVAIAVVYGVLGLAVVLTGSTFGALNASPWFNLAIAAIFILLGLAMFDVILIDFSRFGGGAGHLDKWKKGSMGLALFMGAVSALLAGACVAPVVIAVLLFSARLFASGQVAGLLMPFVLGLGMALPWPFAGAGMGLLPKPGGWMVRVKYLFGIFILVMAAYYGTLGIKLLRGQGPVPAKSAQVQTRADGWETSLDQALAESRSTGRPLFIDFWATWCKNCHAMEATTFRNETVRGRLGSYVRLKFQAEDPGQPEIRAVLEHFGVIGLPTYVILKPQG